MSDTTTDAPVRPDPEFYTRIVEELDRTKDEQALLRIVKLYDDTVVPVERGGNKSAPNLWHYVYTGPARNVMPKGSVLEEKLVAVQLRRELLEGLLDEWNDQEQAWLEAQPVPEIVEEKTTDEEVAA